MHHVTRLGAALLKCHAGYEHHVIPQDAKVDKLL